MKIPCFVFITSLLLACTCTFAQQNDPLPTMQELQQLMADKQWQPLLQKLPRVLVLKGNAAQGYDRYELLMMKGEASLQLKQNSGAVQAFGEAAKDPGATKPKIAIASTSALLAKRSSNGIYKRKSPTTQPSEEKQFDLTDHDKRKAAFAALAADENATIGSKVKAATTSTNLRGVYDTGKSLGDLRNAEIAAGDGASTTTPMSDGLVGPLVTHAVDLSKQSVSNYRVKVETIEKSASSVIDVADRRGGYGHTGVATRYKKRGLIGTDMQTLKDIIQQLDTVTAGDKELADVFGDAGKALLEVSADAQKLGERAKVILNADYSITSDTPAGVR